MGKLFMTAKEAAQISNRGRVLMPAEFIDRLLAEARESVKKAGSNVR
jgi:hypothetical protein